jgi:hypothetical protein
MTLGSRLFFFHNPKAGGTAVGRVMASLFPAEARCPLIENTEREHQDNAGNYAEYSNYAYYGGHYGYDIFSSVSSGHRAVTNFRDPVNRLVSLYGFYRQVPLPENPADLDNLYPVAFAHRSSFRQFVGTGDPRVEIHTRNHHVRQLTSSAWDPASRGDLSHARTVLAEMPWFYVCAYPGQSQRWAQDVFGPRFGQIQRENVTGPQAAVMVDRETRRIIHAKNGLDQALYADAVRRLTRPKLAKVFWFFFSKKNKKESTSF